MYSASQSWQPFGLLALTLVLSIALINGTLDDLPERVVNGISLNISLALQPTSLFIFFIGGLVAPRASYIAGGILGLLSATVWTAVMTIATETMRDQYADTLLTANAEGEIVGLISETIVQTLLLGLGLVLGVVGGFAGWIASSARNRRGRDAEA